MTAHDPPGRGLCASAEPAACETPWRDGWYRYARRLDSPNFGRRPEGVPIDLIVVHAISLPPGVYGGDAVMRLFTNELDWDAHPYFDSIRGLQVSSHFYIQRCGGLWQFVRTEDRAWHAGVSAYLGRTNCNDHSIGIELEGIDGDLYSEAQYESLLSLSAALAQALPIRHVAGHEHIAPGRKRDPGAGFDWNRLRRGLGWPPGCFPSATDSTGSAEDNGRT